MNKNKLDILFGEERFNMRFDFHDEIFRLILGGRERID